MIDIKYAFVSKIRICFFGCLCSQVSSIMNKASSEIDPGAKNFR